MWLLIASFARIATPETRARADRFTGRTAEKHLLAGDTARKARSDLARRRRHASGLGNSGGFHGRAHLCVGLVHERAILLGVGPDRAEAARAHEVLVLLGDEENLERGGELGSDVR